MQDGGTTRTHLTAIAAMLAAMAIGGGCATVRTTDPQRTATEQFLMTEAAARAIERLSASSLRDQLVFVDAAYLSGYEQQFILGELRAKLLTSGVRLTSRREDARIIVEVRSGGVGIDRYDYLLGIPSFVMPTSVVIGGTPLITPEVAIVKNQKQRGYASIAFVAYWAATGELVDSAGPSVGRTNRVDYWFLGTGPRTVGNIPPAERP